MTVGVLVTERVLFFFLSKVAFGSLVFMLASTVSEVSRGVISLKFTRKTSESFH